MPYWSKKRQNQTQPPPTHNEKLASGTYIDTRLRIPQFDVVTHFLDPYDQKMRTSKYVGVAWDDRNSVWMGFVMINNIQPEFFGVFEDEHVAAAGVNCQYIAKGRYPPNPWPAGALDKYLKYLSGMERNQRMNRKQDNRDHEKLRLPLDWHRIATENELQPNPNHRRLPVQRRSLYEGVFWDPKREKWLAHRLLQKEFGDEHLFGGYYDLETHAAFAVNLLCDGNKIPRANPYIPKPVNFKYTRHSYESYHDTPISASKNTGRIMENTARFKNLEVQLKSKRNSSSGNPMRPSIYHRKRKRVTIDLTTSESENSKSSAKAPNPRLNRSNIGQKKVQSSRGKKLKQGYGRSIYNVSNASTRSKDVSQPRLASTAHPGKPTMIRDILEERPIKQKRTARPPRTGCDQKRKRKELAFIRPKKRPRLNTSNDNERNNARLPIMAEIFEEIFEGSAVASRKKNAAASSTVASSPTESKSTNSRVCDEKTTSQSSANTIKPPPPTLKPKMSEKPKKDDCLIVSSEKDVSNATSVGESKAKSKASKEIKPSIKLKVKTEKKKIDGRYQPPRIPKYKNYEPFRFLLYWMSPDHFHRYEECFTKEFDEEELDTLYGQYWVRMEEPVEITSSFGRKVSHVEVIPSILGDCEKDHEEFLKLWRKLQAEGPEKQLIMLRIIHFYLTKACVKNGSNKAYRNKPWIPIADMACITGERIGTVNLVKSEPVFESLHGLLRADPIEV